MGKRTPCLTLRIKYHAIILYSSSWRSQLFDALYPAGKDHGLPLRPSSDSSRSLNELAKELAIDYSFLCCDFIGIGLAAKLEEQTSRHH